MTCEESAVREEKRIAYSSFCKEREIVRRKLIKIMAPVPSIYGMDHNLLLEEHRLDLRKDLQRTVS